MRGNKVRDTLRTAIREVGMTLAFVAGATGYTGREVVRALRERGVPTWAHVRPDSSRLAEWRSRFEALGAKVDTTPWDEAALIERFKELQPTHIFALLGTTRARGRRGADGAVAPTYEAVDYGLTAMLIRAALEAGIRPRFVYLSSAGVREGTTNAYLAARARAEHELRSSGLPYTIARPSFITGADRDEPRPGELYGAKVGDALLSLAGLLGAKNLRDRYRSTTNRVLGSALVRLAFDPAAEGRVVESEGLREPVTAS